MITPEIGLGQLIMPAITLVLGVMGYGAFKSKVESFQSSTGKKLEDLDRDLKAANAVIQRNEMFVAQNCVMKNDVEKIEERISARLDNMEATVRETSSAIIKALTDGVARRRGPAG